MGTEIAGQVQTLADWIEHNLSTILQTRAARAEV
jgi:hypothetical protein